MNRDCKDIAMIVAEVEKEYQQALLALKHVEEVKAALANGLCRLNAVGNSEDLKGSE